MFWIAKKTFLSIKKKFFVVSKMAFFPRGKPMILVQKMPLFLFLCSVKTKLEIVLTDFVDRKETFFDY